MKYFLDFDGVIFDIEAFKQRMQELGFADAPRSAVLFASMKVADPNFNVASFVFEDARLFLEAHREHCYVVSSYVSSNPLLNQNEEEAASYQEEKIRLAGVTGLLGAERINVVGQSKQEALRSLQEICLKNSEECIFVDDREEYVRDAAELGINAMLMNRHHRTVDALVSVSSFKELSEKIHYGA